MNRRAALLGLFAFLALPSEGEARGRSRKAGSGSRRGARRSRGMSLRGGGGRGGGGGSATYANCSQARAEGAAPIRSGDPGYSRKLDRDGDGIACE